MGRIERFICLILWYVVRVYQLTLSFWLGGRCRFTPTCSHYMQNALLTHGLVRGLKLGLTRVARCGPGGGSGFDPVPKVGYEEHRCKCETKRNLQGKPPTNGR